MSVLATGSVAGGVQAKPPIAVTFHASSDDTASPAPPTASTSASSCGGSRTTRSTSNTSSTRTRMSRPTRMTRTAHASTTRSSRAWPSAPSTPAIDHVSWLIPTMKLRIDRVPDVVRGSIGGGLPSSVVEPDYALTVRVFQCSAIRLGQRVSARLVKRSVTADSTGHFRDGSHPRLRPARRGPGLVDLPVDRRGLDGGHLQARAVDALHVRAGPGPAILGFINPNHDRDVRRNEPVGSGAHSVTTTGREDRPSRHRVQ